MFRYLPGILLIQMVTLALFWASAGADLPTVLLQAVLPAVLVAIPTALWFANVGRLGAERTIADVKFAHAREAEGIRLTAERDRASAREEAQKTLFRQERSVHRKANLKVGLAFAAACGVGVLMVLIELMTLGLLTITTAGGALGGYLLRWRQSLRGKLSYKPVQAPEGEYSEASGPIGDRQIEPLRLPELRDSRRSRVT